LKKLLSTAVLSLSLLILLIPTPNSYATPAVLFSTNFDGGVPGQFSGITTTESVQGYAGQGGFNGDFLRNTVAPPQPTTLTLTGLACHSSVLINFDLAIIDSWDGTGSGNGPDTFTVKLDGNTVFSQVFESASGTQTYENPATSITIAFKQALGFNGAFADSAYDMSMESAFFKIPHFGNSLVIDWVTLAPGWQGGTDESWAIDNVEILLSGFDDPRCDTTPPPPPTVGGEFLQIDSTALLLAAAQSPAAWLSSLALVAIGIGAFVFTRNPSNMRNIKVILRDYLDRL